MTTTSDPPIPAGKTTLRVYSQGNIPVSTVYEFLSKIEFAYNSIVIYNQLLDERVRTLTAERGSPEVLANRLQHLWPLTPEVAARLVPDDQKLILQRVVLQSPGFWDFVGSLSPLQVLVTYLNDRHERLKDNNFRNTAEARKLELENCLLENKVIQGRIEIVNKLKESKGEMNRLKSQLLDESLQSLGQLQERSLITKAKLVNGSANRKIRHALLLRDYLEKEINAGGELFLQTEDGEIKRIIPDFE